MVSAIIKFYGKSESELINRTFETLALRLLLLV
jgi:hypothetical protein